jgi:hypothetical protein
MDGFSIGIGIYLLGMGYVAIKILCILENIEKIIEGIKNKG